MDDRHDFRASVLALLGATPDQVEELIRYNENTFDYAAALTAQFPLPDEPFVKTWQQYADEVQEAGSIDVLAQYIVELRFPIYSGISHTTEYRAATREGADIGLVNAIGLQLRSPEQCRIMVHQTPAGRIPLIIAQVREDFVALVQALSKHNEPAAIPNSMGAVMVSGYINWHRIHSLRETFDVSHISQSSWNDCLQRIKEQKHLYQDRFIILSRGPYSGVPASHLGLEEEEWEKVSLAIRREHECTHYFTRRVFSSMRNNLIDELIADFSGITNVVGRFRADWLLRFFGLELFPNYREGGRLQSYRGDPRLSDGAFALLQRIVKQAAENLEHFDCNHANELRQPEVQPALLMTLASFTAEELASDQAETLLSERLAFLRREFLERSRTNEARLA